MLIMACLVLEFGMDPNCLLSILANTASFRCRSITKSSANFDRIGVKDIGRKWLFISVMGFFLGIATISSSFQDFGTRHSR
jgi:hypothetical protein